MNWRKKVLVSAIVIVLGALLLFGAFALAVTSIDDDGKNSLLSGDEASRDPSGLDGDDDRDGQDLNGTGGKDGPIDGLDNETGSGSFGDGDGGSGQTDPAIDDRGTSTDGIEYNHSGQEGNGQNDPAPDDFGPVDEKTDDDDDQGNGTEGNRQSEAGPFRVSEPDALIRDFGMALAAVVLVLLFGLAVFSYTRIRGEELLKQERRLAIYKFVIEHPGEHFRALQRAVGLQVGVLSHHINILEKEQLIISEQDGNNRRFYAAGVKRNNGEVRLSRIQENILRTIQSTPGITQSQIAKDLGVNRKVVFYNVKFLSGAGIVTEQKVRRRAHYYPNDL